MNYNQAPPGARVLFWDIENSPIICCSWSLYPESLNHSDILEDWKIISAALKWEDSNEVETSFWQPTSDREISPVLGKDDSRVIRKLHSILSQADVLIGHNADKFDWKKFQARCVQLGLDPVAPRAMIDTLKVARKEFKFTSNRLDYIGQYLGVGRKLETPKGLHKDVIHSVPGSLKIMLDYNKQDVLLLEAIYKKLKPYIRNHPSLYHSKDKDHQHCPKCGSEALTKQGWRLLKTTIQRRLQCKGCGSWMTGKTVARANLTAS